MKKLLVLGCFLSVNLATAMAQNSAKENGVFIGVGGGQARNHLDFSINGSNFSKDDSASYYKVYAGYQFNKNWGAELFYANLGKTSYTGTPYGPSFPMQADFSTSGVGVNGIFYLPLSQGFDLIAKLGLMAATNKYTCEQTCTVFSNTSTNSVAPVFGLGAQYEFTNGLGIRVEYELISGVKHEIKTISGTDSENANFSTISASLQYKF